MYQTKRDVLLNSLEQSGHRVLRPQGSFFILANFSGVPFPNQPLAELDELVSAGQLDQDPTTRTSQDYNYCRWLTVTRGVTAIPPSSFYCPEHKLMANSFARFAFCKGDPQLQEAGRRLCQPHDKFETQ
mmetsp:Transcript_10322/g.20796  ORF Transcript_10322/g.20796 Transcript_10322/m.20796 type:complete len:129 (+) Transcript_10322:232-618(+)